MSYELYFNKFFKKQCSVKAEGSTMLTITEKDKSAIVLSTKKVSHDLTRSWVGELTELKRK